MNRMPRKDAPPFLKLIQSMSRPEFYAHPTEQVELIQTHISYIFIAGNFVYKVKKPLDFGFLDFTSLDKRKHYCQEELRLNRRLAPDIYLGVVGIYENADGRITLSKGDCLIEYAVKMKKLPRDGMLKNLLSLGSVTPAMMEAIARKLADFHRQAETGGIINEAGSVETIRRNHEENFTATESYIDITIPEYQYRFIKSYVYHFMREQEALFKKRVADHRIRDGHGDIHLEHICIMNSHIIIYDCIEFNDRFRHDDTAAEVAFLAMDLEYNGHADYGDIFVNAYIRHTDDPEIRRLLNFYKCYYAFVRGKVVGFKTNDEDIQPHERVEAGRIASSYFNLAYGCAARLINPTLILMAGLTGTGKSVRAKWIAPLLGAEIIQTDVVRKELLNISPTEHRYETFGKGIYIEDINRRTYKKALELAASKLKEGKSMIMDASYKSRAERIGASETAKKLNADFFIIECVCPEKIIRERLDSRMTEAGEPSDGRWEIFQAQKDTFDPIIEFPNTCHITIDTSLSPEACGRKIIEAVRRFS
jgi:aminoglycoside phosphotransferase family enzyme/predicted kinase